MLRSVVPKIFFLSALLLTSSSLAFIFKTTTESASAVNNKIKNTQITQAKSPATQVLASVSSPSPAPPPSPSPPSSPSLQVSTQPSPSSTPQTSTSVEDFLIKEVNEFRTSKGKSSVQKDPYTCDFAKLRAKELTKSFNHSGFRERIDNHQLPYPGYSTIAENIAMKSKYIDVVEGWIRSEGHAENMLLDTPYVCVQNEGNYYAYEGWRP